MRRLVLREKKEDKPPLPDRHLPKGKERRPRKINLSSSSSSLLRPPRPPPPPPQKCRSSSCGASLASFFFFQGRLAFGTSKEGEEEEAELPDLMYPCVWSNRIPSRGGGGGRREEKDGEEMVTFSQLPRRLSSDFQKKDHFRNFCPSQGCSE